MILIRDKFDNISWMRLDCSISSACAHLILDALAFHHVFVSILIIKEDHWGDSGVTFIHDG